MLAWAVGDRGGDARAASGPQAGDRATYPPIWAPKKWEYVLGVFQLGPPSNRYLSAGRSDHTLALGFSGLGVLPPEGDDMVPQSHQS